MNISETELRLYVDFLANNPDQIRQCDTNSLRKIKHNLRSFDARRKQWDCKVKVKPQDPRQAEFPFVATNKEKESRNEVDK